MKELLLAAWALNQVELEAEFVEQLAEEVYMDHNESDTEAPYFIRIINVSEFDNQDEIRELAYIALHHDMDELIKDWCYRSGK